MKIDIKGFFLGGFLGLLVLVLFGFLIGFSAIYLFQYSGGNLTETATIQDMNPFYILSIIGVLASIIGNYISGYLVAKFSTANRLSTAIAVGIVGTILAVIPFGPTEEMTALSLAISAAIPLPLNYLGASSFIKRTNKLKNESGSDASPTPLC